MTRTQIQFPDPLYRRLREVADMNDWPLAEVVRRATELYVQRFPEYDSVDEQWTLPVIDAGGEYLIDPAELHVEADVVVGRSE